MSIIKHIYGMTVEEALTQTKLELKLARAQKSDAQASLMSTPRAAANLAVYLAERKLAHVESVIEMNNSESARITESVKVGGSVEDALRKTQLPQPDMSKFHEKVQGIFRQQREEDETAHAEAEPSEPEPKNLAQEMRRTEMATLILSVRDAGKEVDRLREERRAADKASRDAHDAFVKAGNRLGEARDALLGHLGGGQVGL